jgi:hypothetical protein
MIAAILKMAALNAAEDSHEAIRKLWRTGLAKVGDQLAGRLGWIALSDRSKAHGIHDGAPTFPEQRNEIVIRRHHRYASRAQPVEWEVAMIASDEHIDLTRQTCSSVNSIIRVTRQRLIDQRNVLGRFESLVGEERSDNRDDRSSGLGRTTLLAHDDALPLLDQLVSPDPGENSFFGEREQRVHDREGEEFVGVDKDPLQSSHLRQSLARPASTIAASSAS